MSSCDNCSNCVFAHYAVFPATQEEPEDTEFYCTNDGNAVLMHLSQVQELYPGDVDGSLYDGSEAEGCPEYKLIVAESFGEDCFPVLTSQEKRELDAMAESFAHQQAIERGWIDPVTGEPTDAYFRASDFAYDAARGA